MNESVKHVTDASFDTEVLKAGTPVLVDYWAEWCGPCKMIAPILDEVAKDYAGRITVAKLDVDANPGLSQAFNILSIPVIAFFRPGQQPQGVVGFRPLERLEWVARKVRETKNYSLRIDNVNKDEIGRLAAWRPGRWGRPGTSAGRSGRAPEPHLPEPRPRACPAPRWCSRTSARSRGRNP